MNMSYCRFRNALRELQGCQNYLFDTDLSAEESEARDKLIELIHEIGYDTGIETVGSNDEGC